MRLSHSLLFPLIASVCVCVFECTHMCLHAYCVAKPQRSTSRSPNRAETQTTYRSNEGGNEKVIFTNFSQRHSYSVWLRALSASLQATSARTRQAYATKMEKRIEGLGSKEREEETVLLLTPTAPFQWDCSSPRQYEKEQEFFVSVLPSERDAKQVLVISASRVRLNSQPRPFLLTTIVTCCASKEEDRSRERKILQNRER